MTARITCSTTTTVSPWSRSVDDQPHGLVHLRGVQARHGLVQQHELRLGGQGPGHLQPPLVDGGEAPRRHLRPPLQAHLRAAPRLARTAAADGSGCRSSAPIRTLRCTVMSGNGLATWKVRHSPRAHTSWGGQPGDVPAEERTCPRSGRWKPVMRWKVVVFPEPFGPITPRISPSRTWNVRSRTAWTPPKCLESPSTSRSTCAWLTPAPPADPGSRAIRPRYSRWNNGIDAPRPPEDHRHQEPAVDHQFQPGYCPAKTIWVDWMKNSMIDRPDGRPQDRADPAHDGHQGDLDAVPESEGAVGVDHVGVLGVEDAPHAREEGGERQRPPLGLAPSRSPAPPPLPGSARWPPGSAPAGTAPSAA